MKKFKVYAHATFYEVEEFEIEAGSKAEAAEKAYEATSVEFQHADELDIEIIKEVTDEQ
jgi:hypothetical protein